MQELFRSIYRAARANRFASGSTHIERFTGHSSRRTFPARPHRTSFWRVDGAIHDKLVENSKQTPAALAII